MYGVIRCDPCASRAPIVLCGAPLPTPSLLVVQSVPSRRAGSLHRASGLDYYTTGHTADYCMLYLPALVCIHIRQCRLESKPRRRIRLECEEASRGSCGSFGSWVPLTSLRRAAAKWAGQCASGRAMGGGYELRLPLGGGGEDAR